MDSRKSSLRYAKQYRTCPPPAVVENPSQGKDLDQHLANCPYCSNEKFELLKFWEETAEKLSRVLKAGAPPADREMVQPGQIRLIKPEYGIWVGGFYYNPPWVMVLGRPPGTANGIRVAQVYHDINLAGPGDLILEQQQTGIMELFVECWNTYTLKPEYLGPVIAEVSAEIVESIIRMEEDEHAAPQWAILPMPMIEHDPREYFRKLEVQVGYVFASRAVGKIMDELEKPQLDYRTADELQQDLKKSAKTIRFPRTAASFEEILTSAKFPADAYARAAAADEREYMPANLVVLHSGRVYDFKPIYGMITSKMRTETGLNISGAFPLIPDTARNPRMICFYWSKTTGAMVPDDMHWEVSSGVFYAKFKTAHHDDETVEFALVYEIDGEGDGAGGPE